MKIIKLYSCLGVNERSALLKIFLSMMILVGSEILFLAIISSSLNHLFGVSEIQSFQVYIIGAFQQFSHLISIPLNETVLILSTLILLLKLLISVVFTRYQFTQVYKIKSYLQLSKVDQSINSGIVSDRNMSEDILISVQHLISYFISPILTIVVETVVITGMLLFVIYWGSPLILILILLLIPPIFVLQLIINRKSKRLSQIRSDMENRISKIFSQSQENIPEIYVNDFTSSYLSNMNKKIGDLNSAYATNIFLNALPRQALEVLLLIFILFLVYVYNNTVLGDIIEKSSPALLVPMLLRLVPSAGKLMGSFQNISFSSAVIEKFIVDEDNLSNEIYPSSNVSYKLIELCDTFDCGLVIITGNSGSGKSTELRKLALFLKSRQDSVTYVSQLPYVHEGNVFENMGLTNNRIQTGASLNKLLDIIGMEGFSSRQDKAIDPNLISGGERIRLGILRALSCNNQFVLIDEPTNALDKDNAKVAREQIKILSKQKLVIVVTHDQGLINMNDLMVKL